MPTITYGAYAQTDVITVNDSSQPNAFAPHVARLPDGGFIVVYGSIYSDGVTNTVNGPIRARVFDANGVPVTDEVVISTLDTGIEQQPRVAVAADGQIAIAFLSSNGATSTVRVQFLSSSFVPAGPEIEVPFTGVGPFGVNAPALDISARGEDFIVTVAGATQGVHRIQIDGGTHAASEQATWSTPRNAQTAQVQTSSGESVTVAVDSSGSTSRLLTWSTGTATAEATADDVGNLNDSPAIVALANGAYAIAYRDTQHSGTGGDISLRIFNADGTARSGVILVNDGATTGAQFAPTITALANGMIAVVWQNSVSGSGAIGASFFDQNGQPLLLNIAIDTGSVQMPSATTLADGSIALVWGNAADGTIETRILDFVREVLGDANAETFDGDALRDAVLAGGGDDVIRTFGGDDALAGEAGNDTLDGGDGDDLLIGGAGNDALIGGNGIDTADYAAAPARVVVSLAVQGEQNTEGEGFDTLTGIENLTGSAFDDELRGDDGANVIRGGAGSDIIYGGAGDDNLIGGDGFNLIRAEAGDDRLEGGAQRDSLDGGDGDDIILGGGGDDSLFGENGADYIEGGDGDDQLSDDIADFAYEPHESNGPASIDTMLGGAGDDLVSSVKGPDIMDGGDGHDAATLIRGYITTDLTVNFVAGGASYISDGTQVVNFEQISLHSGSGNDTLNGGVFNDLFRGGDGADTISGDLGDDYLSGGTGADVVTGGDGDDTLDGGLGDDLLDGGDGDDDIFDDDGAPPNGGVALGNDILLGGAGNDHVTSIGGVDVIDGAEGFDLLTLRRIDTAGVAYVVDVAAQLSESQDIGDGTTIVGFEAISVSVFGDNTLHFIGGDYGDVAEGSGRTDLLFGGGGRDFLFGYGGDDVLEGGTGNDWLDGGIGDDILVGGLGDDVLDGWEGVDLVSYRDAVSSVAVNLATSRATGGGGADIFMQIENAEGSAFADTLTGDGGANLLIGGLGNDILEGGDGADVAEFDVAVSAAAVVRYQNIHAVVSNALGVDRIDSIETLRFNGVNYATSSFEEFRAIDYVAGYNDLILAYGVGNLPQAVEHYLAFGFAEGRNSVQFNGWQYLAGYDDLITAFGPDLNRAASHFIQFGYSGGRSRDAFNGADYIASYNDLIMAFGLDEDLAARHYVQFGLSGGRQRDAFDGWQYLASYDDLIINIGADEAAAARQFVRNGFGEGRSRDVYNWLEYIAGYDDLIVAYGANETAGARHFVESGYAGGRTRDAFDGLQYIASYGDLIQAFGENEGTAASHYIQFGYAEGRSRDSFDAAQYIANYADLQAVFGDDLYNATRHYILFGYAEGRTDEDLTPVGGDDALAFLVDKGDTFQVLPVEFDKGDPGPAVLPDDMDFGALRLAVDDGFLIQGAGETPADLRAKGIVMPPEWAVISA